MPTNSITISPIPAFSDNYIWAITSEKNNHLALVDPGDADTCIDFINHQQKQLTSILITHHHIDHVGGIDKLLTFCQENNWPLTIYSPAFKPLPNQATLPIPLKHNKHVDVVISEGDVVELTEFNLKLNVLDVSGHTLEHIAYHNSDMLFCGDALFSGGCGRRFEGSAEQMHLALQKLARLPDSTQVYCAHEYTLANLAFAINVEPDNKNLQQYITQIKKIRSQNIPSLPSSIGQEKNINPFLRTHLNTVRQQVSLFSKKQLTNSIDVFDYLRRWKDQ
mgnify:CR=1 FL=1